MSKIQISESSTKRSWILTLIAATCLSMLSLQASTTPPSALLVLNKGDRNLAIIDPHTMQVVATVPAGENIHEVIASADGKLAFISNYGDGHTLSVVDLVAQKALAPVELGALHSPHGLDQADGKIYFTAEANRIIGRYDPASQQVDWLFGLGQNRTHMIAVTKDAKRIFTSNVNSDSISIIEQTAGEEGPGPGPMRGGNPPVGGGPNDRVRPPQSGPGGPGRPDRGGPPGRPGGPGPRAWNVIHIKVGSGPEGFDVSPNGKEVWAANSHDGTVSIIDVESKANVETLNVGTRASNRLKFTPDGSKVLISDLGGKDLVVLDAGTRKQLKRITLGGGAAGILMEPDGTRAFVAVGSENGVTIIDLKTLEISGHIHTGQGPDGLAWAARN